MESPNTARPTDEDLIGAAVEYGKAQSSLLQSRVELVKSEAKLGALRLAAGLVAALVAAFLLATAWVLMNVALAQWVSTVTTAPGIGFLAVAALNGLAAALLYLFAKRQIGRVGSRRDKSEPQ